MVAKTATAMGRREVYVLGTGRDWADAYERSRTSDLGRAAIVDFVKAKELIKMAVNSESALEFADSVERATLEEAKSVGFTDDQLEELKKKFESARKHIKHADHSNGAEGTEDRPADDSNRGDDPVGATAVHQ